MRLAALIKHRKNAPYSLFKVCTVLLLLMTSASSNSAQSDLHDPHSDGLPCRHLTPASVPVPWIPAAGPVPSVPVSDSQPLVGADGRIDINTASVTQLAEALPGIGPTKAQRIVDWRMTHGPFNSIEQLLDVQGIGPKTLEKFRTLVRIGDAATAATKAREAQASEQAVHRAVARIVARAEDDARQASATVLP